MGLKIHHIDAFASRAFTGNPAAVCLLETTTEETWMQQVAMEMNLAETAFLLRKSDGAYDLRWFTPTTEVELCGHATLAGAHFLWETGAENREACIPFDTLSGRLTARQISGKIELDFPAEVCYPCETPAGLLQALNLHPAACKFVGRNRFDYLLQLNTAAAVRALAPDMSILSKLDCRGIIVTSVSDTDNCHFTSRFFAPAAGISEDPVTGSAHCCLAPFWSERTGLNELTGFQASRRGGFVFVKVAGDRVKLAGNAITTVRGELADNS